jgi:hypothetical protein
MSKKIWLSLLALTVVACGLVSLVFITTACAIIPFSFSAATQGITVTPSLAGVTVTPTLTVIPSIESPAAESTATEFVPLSTLQPDIAQQMDKIQQQVMSYRGLKLKTSLKRALMTPDQLKDKVINDFFKDYTPADAQQDTDVLSALGLLEPDFDLLTFYQKLYAEQIAGYYDQKTKDMYVISGEAFGGTERMTYAHEFTHALQDQTYDIENGLNYNDAHCKADSEYCAAVSALMEGDATLSEYYWFARFSTDQDKQDVATFQQTYTSPVYDSAPTYMKDDFLFPYQQGYDFVNYLYGKNKWTSVNAAYKNPPVSTEQILHPEKYPNDVPIKVTVPDFLPTLGTGWKEVERNVMGEWYTYLILADGRNLTYQLPKQDAKDAAAGWGGDTYVYYNNPDSSRFVLVWVSQWDTTSDADQFFLTGRTYGNDRWGSSQTSSTSSVTWQTTDVGQMYMSESGSTVIWLMTPDLQTQQTILSALNE